MPKGEKDVPPKKRVKIGEPILVKYLDEVEPVTHIIINEGQSDPGSGRILDKSPIGKALLGRQVNEAIEIETPGGILKVEILGVG